MNDLYWTRVTVHVGVADAAAPLEQIGLVVEEVVAEGACMALGVPVSVTAPIIDPMAALPDADARQNAAVAFPRDRQRAHLVRAIVGPLVNEYRTDARFHRWVDLMAATLIRSAERVASGAEVDEQGRLREEDEERARGLERLEAMRELADRNVIQSIPPHPGV